MPQDVWDSQEKQLNVAEAHEGQLYTTTVLDLVVIQVLLLFPHKKVFA